MSYNDFVAREKATTAPARPPKKTAASAPKAPDRADDSKTEST